MTEQKTPTAPIAKRQWQKPGIVDVDPTILRGPMADAAAELARKKG